MNGCRSSASCPTPFALRRPEFSYVTRARPPSPARCAPSVCSTAKGLASMPSKRSLGIVLSPHGNVKFRRHRLKASERTLPVGPVPGLAQDQKSGQPGDLGRPTGEACGWRPRSAQVCDGSFGLRYFGATAPRAPRPRPARRVPRGSSCASSESCTSSSLRRGIHEIAAAYHYYIRRDGVLRSMLR